MTARLVQSFMVAGVVGVVGLSLFYYLLLWFVSGDPVHPLNQFVLLQPWMSMLIVGFGVQAGLFWLLHQGVLFSVTRKKEAVATAGGGAVVSGTAMVACCAHHLVEVMPILGLSAGAIFLSEYQKELLIFGVVANLVGILMMVWMLFGKVGPKQIVGWLVTKPLRSQA